MPDAIVQKNSKSFVNAVLLCIAKVFVLSKSPVLWVLLLVRSTSGCATRKKTSEKQATTSGQRRRPKDVGAKLPPPDQAQEIRCLIIDKNPQQLKFDFALWTRRAVKG